MNFSESWKSGMQTYEEPQFGHAWYTVILCFERRYPKQVLFA